MPREFGDRRGFAIEDHSVCTLDWFINLDLFIAVVTFGLSQLTFRSKLRFSSRSLGNISVLLSVFYIFNAFLRV